MLINTTITSLSEYQYFYHSFVFSTLTFRLFFYCIQQVSVNNIGFYEGVILAQGLLIMVISDIVGTHALDHPVYYECLLLFKCVM